MGATLLTQGLHATGMPDTDLITANSPANRPLPRHTGPARENMQVCHTVRCNKLTWISILKLTEEQSSIVKFCYFAFSFGPELNTHHSGVDFINGAATMLYGEPGQLALLTCGISAVQQF